MGVKKNLLRNNVEYWQASLDAPEPLIDPFYTQSQIILTDSFVSEADALREFLGVYCFLHRRSEKDSQTDVVRQYLVSQIDNLLRSSEQLQYTEFVAFWKCSNVSYSVYRRLAQEKRIETLVELLNLYCHTRKPTYDKHGYSHIVSQALYDAGASRSQGSSVIQKLETMLRGLSGSDVQPCLTLEAFRNREGIRYFFPDRGGQQLYDELCAHYGLSYEYGKVSQGKRPDAVIKVRTRVYIVEAKHLQEGGGHQNEQLSQLVRFISFSETNPKPNAYDALSKLSFSYVAFLDGWYFNQLVGAHELRTQQQRRRVSDKVLEQYDSIETQLKNNPDNYFVNTQGLWLLLRDSLPAKQRRRVPITFDGGT